MVDFSFLEASSRSGNEAPEIAMSKRAASPLQALQLAMVLVKPRPLGCWWMSRGDASEDVLDKLDSVSCDDVDGFGPLL